jgi:lambda family phage portal protein
VNLRRRITGAVNALLGRSLHYDAAGGGNRLANWKAAPAAVNTWQTNPALLRGRAEDAFRNNPAARKAVEAWIQAAIGASGINPQLKDKRLKQFWSGWADSCDAAGRMDWISIQSQILQTVLVSGECFIVFAIEPRNEVPISLQVLGPEFLDTARVDNRTFEGIEFDGSRRTGYWLFESSPVITRLGLKSRRFDARDVLHIFRPTHPGAQRGVSWLAPVLLVLRELQEYFDASLTKAKVAALLTGFVTSQDGANPLKPTSDTPVLEPGSMVRLQPGESVEFSQPPQDSNMLDYFVTWQMRRIAAGLNMPYEILAGDHSRVTFASGRHGLLEWQRHIEAIQHNLLVAQFCAPVFRRWAELTSALGLVEGDIETPRWIGPQLAMLDPKSEVAASLARVRAGFVSRSEVVSASGWSVEDIDTEIAADNARADSLGLVLDTDPRRVTLQGLAQQPQQSNEEQPQ